MDKRLHKQVRIRLDGLRESRDRQWNVIQRQTTPVPFQRPDVDRPDFPRSVDDLRRSGFGDTRNGDPVRSIMSGRIKREKLIQEYHGQQKRSSISGRHADRFDQKATGCLRFFWSTRAPATRAAFSSELIEMDLISEHRVVSTETEQQKIERVF